MKQSHSIKNFTARFRCVLIASLTVIISIITVSQATALPLQFFGTSSRLAEGNWIKISVGNTGIYEITYDELKAMGFNNPQSVGVYGRGGHMLNEDFIDTSNNILISDDILPVPVMHTDNKLLFYAEGPENIRYCTDVTNPSKRRFERKNLNIYSTHGYYFLAEDRTDRIEIETISEGDFYKSMPLMQYGWDYFYHEKDLVFNFNNSGQQFWGEDFITNPKLTIPWSDSSADTSTPASLECIFVHGGQSNSANSAVTWGFDGQSLQTSKLQTLTDYHTYTTASPSSAQITLPGTSGDIIVNYKQAGTVSGAHLDYLLLGYRKQLEFKPGESQIRAFLPDYDTASYGYIAINNAPETTIAWDITSANELHALPVEIKEGTAHISHYGSLKKEGMLIAFDPTATQKKISGYEAVGNQNLHAMEGVPDMIIITVDERYDDAEKLAAFHREVEGLDVRTVRSQQIINEFSGGTPDAMAYRIFAKMFYDRQPGKLKYLLFYGPMQADIRGITAPSDSEMMIAYQSEESDRLEHTYGINDFHGYMQDKYPSSQNGNNLYLRPIDISVAALPIRSSRDAEIIYDKVVQSYYDNSYAYWLGTNQSLADAGDENSHVILADNIATTYSDITGGAGIASKVYLDAFPLGMSQRRFIDNLNRGVLFSQYFGHGDLTSLSSSTSLWNSTAIYNLNNTRLGFMTFAGCNVTSLDHNFRGSVETMIFTPGIGLIGGLLTTRVGWSTQNWEFVRYLQKAIYLEDIYDESTMISTPRTIGEAYRIAKSTTANSNKFIYQLMCDPLVTLPVPSKKIIIDNIEGQGVLHSQDTYTIQPGSRITISGHIYSGAATDRNFNGTAVVRIFDNAIDKKLPNYLSGANENATIRFDEETVAITEAEVIDGKFTASLVLPPTMNLQNSKLPASIRATAYNPDSRQGAIGIITFDPGNVDSKAIITDKQAPEIESFYLNTPDFTEGNVVAQSFTVYATISDDVAVSPLYGLIGSSVTLCLDNNKFFRNAASYLQTTDGGATATLSFPISGVSTGEHSLTLEVADMYGHTTAKTLRFSVGENCNTGSISFVDIATRNETRINIQLNSTADKKTLVFINSDGECVRKANAGTNKFDWDLKDNNGERVPAGLYTVYCLYTTQEGAVGYTNSAKIPVLDAHD